MCCIPVWVGREARECFICARKRVWVWNQGKKTQRVLDKCTGAVGACSHAVTTLIAVSSTVMDFLFWLLREKHYYHSSWLAPSSVQMSGAFLFFATWASYFSLSREKVVVLCGVYPVSACFLVKFFLGTLGCTNFPNNKGKGCGLVVMFWHSLCTCGHKQLMAWISWNFTVLIRPTS